MTASPTVLGGRYTLVRILGAGGMAEVWLATDQRLNGRYVAVKRLLHRTGGGDAAEQVERARREAYAVSGLHHPNIVSVSDFLVEQGEPVIVMEYVEGRTLHDLGGLPPQRAAWLVSQAAAGLAEAHARGILHRDVKPANVLVTERGEAKLADFGIARVESDPRLTATGMFTGTIRYLAPEILAGQPATAASDVWSLGVTLFETVEGRPAFDAPTHVALISAIAMGEVPRLGSAPAMAPLVTRMLDRDPQRRPTAAAVAAELLSLVGAPSSPVQPLRPSGVQIPPFMPATPPPDDRRAHAPTVVPNPAPSRPGRPPAKRRNRGWILVAAPVAVVIAAVGIAIGVRSGDSDNTPLAGARPGDTAPPTAGHTPAPTTSQSTTGSTTTTPGVGGAPGASTTPSGAVSFAGVTVRNPRDLTRDPAVSSSSATDPTALRTLDLVTGTGRAAAPTATVRVQYAGVLYRAGTPFDSSWARGTAASFLLTQTIPGFRTGIGGGDGTAPMRVGGRRILIIPAALGYGATGQDAIPPNSSLVFVVDLVGAG